MVSWAKRGPEWSAKSSYLEIGMLNRLACSFIVASAFIGVIGIPSFAGDDTVRSVVQFPVRATGCGLSTVLGAPLGATRDSVRGGQAAAKFVAKTLGNEDGDMHMLVGYAAGGPFGVIGGATCGSVKGLVHGFKTGYDKPFSKDSFTFKEEQSHIAARE